MLRRTPRAPPPPPAPQQPPPSPEHSPARSWWHRSPPISRLHRALFYWSELCLCFLLDGPPAKAIDLLLRTHAPLVPYWPAGWARDLAGGPSGLQLASELCWFSLTAAALSASAAAASPPPRATRALLAAERLALLCCAPSFLLLHAVQFGLTDYQHQYHAVLYALAALAALGPESRLATRWVLLALVHTYASAALAKLLNAGGSWASGAFLCRLLRRRGETLPLPPPVCAAAAWGAVLAEGASVGALLFASDRTARALFVAGASAFHLFNCFSIGASFVAQIGVLLLVVPPPLSDAAGAPDERPPKPRRAGRSAAQERRGERVSAGVASCTAAGLAAVALLRVECWPLTYVPMYSGNYETVSEEIHFSLEIKLPGRDSDEDLLALDWVWCPPRCELADSKARRQIHNLAALSGCKDSETLGDGATRCLGLPEPKMLQLVLRQAGFGGLLHCWNAGGKGGTPDRDCPAPAALEAAWNPGASALLVPLEYIAASKENPARQLLQKLSPVLGERLNISCGAELRYVRSHNNKEGMRHPAGQWSPAD
ncbi:hypothetical protein AB1Y20_019464 [Prymnesium parvum]|uniref:Mannosyltransferase n=1 Tax=Prymnesium parvum TaxID=97485 RepID=A0AB34JVX9_PRYPA